MSGEQAMARHGVLRIDDQPGTKIHVRSGAVWLTQEGDARDYYLTAGQSFTVERGGTALAVAMCRSSVSVTPAAPRESRAQRLLKILASLVPAHA